MKWITDHWALILSIQQAAAFLCSLVYGRLDQAPRWHAFFSLCAASGVDLPKVIDAWQRWLANTPPPPPKTGSQNPPPLSRRPPPMSMRGGKIGLALGAGLLVGSLTGCVHTLPPPNVVDDFGEIVKCVLAHDSSWTDVATNCAGYSLAELEAVLQWLLADPKFAQAHPELLPALQARLGELRAEKAKRQ